MADDILDSIRSVTDRAIERIAPGSLPAAPSAGPQQRLLLDAMAARVDPGGVPLSGVRLRTIRRVLLKLIRPSTESQWAFNLDVHRALSDALAGIRAEKASLDTVRAGLVSLEILADTREASVRNDLDELRGSVGYRVDMLNESTVRLTERVEEMADSVERIAADLQRSRGELARHRAVVDLVLRELRSSENSDGPDIAAITRPLDDSYDSFYEDFESVFRGSREDVMKTQRPYIDLVADLPGPVLDIGPGRGEWLELLKDAGVESGGVEINAEFVASCHSRGLDVTHADAFDHLRAIPEASLGAITAFQVVEHLPFEQLVDLLGLCLVAMRPDAVLILETPNPSNLKVGSMSFWNDPSHIHPLPPGMLEFLVQWRGFTNTEVRFPPPPVSRALAIEGDDSRELDDINWAMFGPEDYAVVAYRP